MFSCLSRKHSTKIKLKNKPSIEKTQTSPVFATHQLKEQGYIQTRQVSKTGGFINKKQQKQRNYDEQDQQNIKQSIQDRRAQIIDTIKQQFDQKISQASSQLHMSQINCTSKTNPFKFEEAVSSTSFDLYLQTQRQFKKQIYQIVLGLTRPLIFMPKNCQSSLAGMRKVCSCVDISQPSVQPQIEQISQFKQKDSQFCDLNQQFSKSLINLNYVEAQSIFKKMFQQQKNKQDSQGFTPIYLATLFSIKDPSKGLIFLKKLLKDKQINPNQKINNGSKPIQVAILFRNLPTLTNLFRASYMHKIVEVKKSIINFVKVLDTISDFHIQLFVKVNSFIPLIDKISPNDTIKIYKKGRKLRIDYSLVGYTLLQTKRRRISCVIQQINKQQYTILIVNHDKQSYSDLLQPFEDQELLLLVEDLALRQTKKNNPEIHKAKINQQLNIFNQAIRQQTFQGIAIKHSLKVTYISKTQKIKPNCKNPNKDLQFLNTWSAYLSYKAQQNIQQKQKQLNLGVWLTQHSPLSFEILLEMMKFISFSHQSGQIVYNFLAEKKVRQIFNGFPIKIQIPINFSLYLDIKFDYMSKICPQQIQFQFMGKYKKQRRADYQKNLVRKQKRSAIIKFYT